MKLLLASRSATRRRMLEAAGVAFELDDSGFDEEGAKRDLRAAGVAAKDLALALARLKASHVHAPPDQLALGADQTLERDDGSMLDKPQSRHEAFAQLRSLSGRQHRLHSAAVLYQGGRSVWESIETVVLGVRPLSDSFLVDYLDAEYEAVRHGVGGYRIEGRGLQLFDTIEGSHFAILGLPMLPLLAYLRERALLPS